MGVRVRGGKKQVHAAGRAIFGCIMVWHSEIPEKQWEKTSFKMEEIRLTLL